MSISINDGKVTPAAHSFSQDREQQGNTPALFVNRATTAGPLSWETIESQAKLAQKSGDTHLTRHVLTRPFIGTRDGAPYVIGRHKVFVTITSDQAVSGEDDLNDTQVLTANWLSNTNVKTSGKKLAPFVG